MILHNQIYSMNIKKLPVFSTIVFTLLLTLFPIPTHASNADFDVVSTYNIYWEKESNDTVKVEQILEITANNSQYYIPYTSTQKIELPDFDPKNKDENRLLKKNSLRVQDAYGNAKKYTLSETETGLTIAITNSSDITRSNPFYAKISFDTKELINKNGNITNLYIPALHVDTKFTEIDPKYSIKTVYQYNSAFFVPQTAQAPSFMNPKNIVISKDGKYTKYSIDQLSRVNHTSWIQLGTDQYYHFKLTQKIPRTDFFTPQQISDVTDLVSTNVLKLALPREFTETKQEVFFKTLPENIKKIEMDAEGNYIASLEVKANQENTIVLEGYIHLTRKDAKDIPNLSLTEYKKRLSELNNLSLYTKADKYWESDNPQILKVANDLLASKEGEGVVDIIRADYNFVIDKLTYSYEKLENGNERFGALGALNGSQAVCMEYADLLTAILRAQGIPSRSAIGYGNDPTLSTSSSAKTGHQWVQVWIPDYGWLSVDPTWGETQREYIGGDLDHILWYTVASSSQDISESIIFSADSVSSNILQDYNVEINPLKQADVPDLTTLTAISDLSSQYQDVKENKIEDTLKTTLLGRTLVLITPVCMTIVVITGVFSLISGIIAARKRKAVTTEAI